MLVKLISFLIILSLITAVWQSLKPMPEGINYESKQYNLTTNNVEFIYDLTVNEKKEQKIFNKVLGMINSASEYILIDMFLFNDYTGNSKEEYRKISNEITSALVVKINKNPEIKIDFVTDNINTVYGGVSSDNINTLKSAGVNVIMTDLRKLRDPNTLYSPIWRTVFQWFGNSDRPGLFSNPFSTIEQKVSLRSYMSLLNFKANHRKLIIADKNGEMNTLITSANPHDASSNHSNVAIKIGGNFWREVYMSEKAVAQMSGMDLSNVDSKFIKEAVETSNMKVKLLTEKKIKENLINDFDEVSVGDVINVAMFYLSDRNIINSIIKAANKGVIVNIVLDPNKDAFGRSKGGIPNRQVAHELRKKSDNKINIRWYNTNGEQFHSKLVFIKRIKQNSKIYLGSANLTKRNIGNYNLESDVLVEASIESSIYNSVDSYFDKIWSNENETHYTVSYNVFSDDAFFKTIWYRFQEFSGLSSY